MKNGIGIGLFALGAVAGVLGSARFFKTKYEKLSAEEVQEVRDFYAKRVKEFKSASTLAWREPASDISSSTSEKSSIGATGPSDPRSYDDLTDYARYSGAYRRQSTEEVVASDTEAESPSEPAEKKKQKPVLIPMERYGDSDEFEPKVIYYYAMGEVLTLVDEDTDDEEQIEETDVPEMFGDCLTKYSFTTSDEDVIYIRSPRRKEDYKVIKVRGYYS